MFDPIKNLYKNITNRSNSRKIILIYHRVADVVSDPWSLCVSPSHFEEHLKILRKYVFLFPGLEGIRQSSNSDTTEKSIALTFDDGYVDNFINAMPSLEKYNIPATFFIVSGVIGNNKEYWWDYLERLIIYPQSLPNAIELKINEKTYRWKTKQVRITLYMEIWKTFNLLTSKEKILAINQLEEQIKEVMPVREGYLPLNKDQLISLSRSAFCQIGAHTVNHCMLTNCSLEDQKYEISQCKNDLETMTGKKINNFAYPFGNYSDKTVQLLKDTGFNTACSTIEENIRKDTSPYLLPRRWVFNWNGQEFERKIKQWIGAV